MSTFASKAYSLSHWSVLFSATWFPALLTNSQSDGSPRPMLLITRASLCVIWTGRRHLKRTPWLGWRHTHAAETLPPHPRQ